MASGNKLELVIEVQADKAKARGSGAPLRRARCGWKAEGRRQPAESGRQRTRRQRFAHRRLGRQERVERNRRDDHGLANEPRADVVPVLQQFCEKVLEPLCAWCGRPLSITSGYRCPELNKLIGGMAPSRPA
jgi:hypothetical protein